MPSIPAAAFAMLALSACAVARPGLTNRVSLASLGGQADGHSLGSAISADGRIVAFSSGAANLVPGDTNNTDDIFVHDRLTGRLTRVSVDSNGNQANAFSATPSLSADGRYVGFLSWADNLVPGDTNLISDAFVHDRVTGQTTRVSVNSAGVQSERISNAPILSADGRYALFESEGSNLVPGDTNGAIDIFLHDRQTGQTTRVNVNSFGTQANSISRGASISADNRFVAYSSSATNLVPGDTNNADDVFVHDRQTGQVSRISLDSAANQANGNSSTPQISADGLRVAFISDATNLVPGDTNQFPDAFVHDRQTAQTTRVSVSSAGTQANAYTASPVRISGAGRFIMFYTAAGNLVPDDSNNSWDVFVHDRQSGQTLRVSVSSAGAQANSHSSLGDLSGDGRFAVFSSDATNLVPNDTNQKADVFARDLDAVICPGDANGDRVVGFADLQLVLSFYATSVFPGLSGDVNGDGVVDFLDLNLVLSYFGAAC